MKLEHASERDAEGEGEICVRGRHVMMESGPHGHAPVMLRR